MCYLEFFNSETFFWVNVCLTSLHPSRWRFTFYLCIFCYGIRFLWLSPWFWDTRQCWHSYPYQPLTSGLYYYYIMELAFYWSLMFSQFTDIKRKVRTLAPLTPWFMAPSFPAATIIVIVMDSLSWLGPQKRVKVGSVWLLALCNVLRSEPWLVKYIWVIQGSPGWKQLTS